MSVFGAFYSKNNIVFVTDTIGCRKTPLIKEEKLFPESFASLTSKTLYYPHFQTAICVMGLTALSTKINQFIDQSGCLVNMDSLLKRLSSDFMEFFQKDQEVMALNVYKETPNWLGVAIIIGASTFQGDNYEGENSIRIIKTMVWKDKIEFKVVNELRDREFDVAFMPRLPDESINKIFATEWSREYDNQIEGVLIEHMKELKLNYDSSGREDYMVGGELNLTTMTFNDPSTFVSQRTVYRFPDFWDNVKEIEEFTERHL